MIPKNPCVALSATPDLISTNSEHPTTADSGKNPNPHLDDRFQTGALSARIDFLRGAFAVWVLVAHTFELSNKGTTHEWWNVWPGVWLNTLLHSGYFGVTGFFFLSGFCIHWSIAKNIERVGISSFSFRSYLKARFLRIAPLFYLGLALALAAQWVCLHCLEQPGYARKSEGSIHSIVASIGFLQGIFGAHPLYGASWSITNEILYYIAWPVILSLVGFQTKKAIPLAVIGALMLMAVFYPIWRKTGDQNWIAVSALWLIPMASLMWITGAWARIYYDRIITHRCFKALQSWWWLILILWVGWSTTLVTLKVSLLTGTILNPLGYVAIPLLALGGWKVPVSKKVNGWLADLSYPLYLFHGPLLILACSFIYTMAPGLGQFPSGIIAGLASLLISGTIGVKLERIFLAWRSRGRKSRLVEISN